MSYHSDPFINWLKNRTIHELKYAFRNNMSITDLQRSMIRVRIMDLQIKQKNYIKQFVKKKQNVPIEMPTIQIRKDDFIKNPDTKKDSEESDEEQPVERINTRFGEDVKKIHTLKDRQIKDIDDPIIEVPYTDSAPPHSGKAGALKRERL